MTFEAARKFRIFKSTEIKSLLIAMRAVVHDRLAGL
jgi:hypothetical protein